MSGWRSYGREVIRHGGRPTLSAYQKVAGGFSLASIIAVGIFVFHQDALVVVTFIVLVVVLWLVAGGKAAHTAAVTSAEQAEAQIAQLQEQLGALEDDVAGLRQRLNEIQLADAHRTRLLFDLQQQPTEFRQMAAEVERNLGSAVVVYRDAFRSEAQRVLALLDSDERLASTARYFRQRLEVEEELGLDTHARVVEAFMTWSKALEGPPHEVASWEVSSVP